MKNPLFATWFLSPAAVAIAVIVLSLFISVRDVCAAPAPDSAFPKQSLVLWYDAASTRIDGRNVAQLFDRSGQGNHATHSAEEGNLVPVPAVVKDPESSQPVLRFSGDLASFDFRRLSDIRAVFYVVRKDPAASKQNNERFVLGDTETKDFHVGTHRTDFLLDQGESSPFASQGQWRVNGQPVNPLQAEFSPKLSVISLVSTGPLRANQLSRDRKFPERSWQGDIGEILVFNAALSDADRHAVEKYLMDKYRIKPEVSNSNPTPMTTPQIPAPPAAPMTPTNDYAAPFNAAAAGLTSLFDGQTLNGWVGNPEGWKVVDGAIVGVKDNQNLMTVGDYDDFRLIVSSVQVKDPYNHQGVGFWGDRLPAGTWGYGGCILVMPPMHWTWDYVTNGGPSGKMLLSRDLDKELGLKRFQWTQAEILVNRAKGSIRMAINGVEMLHYVDDTPSRFKKGPIGLQAHGGNQEVRYKDVFIEVSPKEDRLITLK